ncbi:MAG TPA: hypothetical protein VLE22_00385, partial [Bryobacteraceae bacterium]|nr:hypothetical protein [Bryobacteraceae bacterium]
NLAYSPPRSKPTASGELAPVANRVRAGHVRLAHFGPPEFRTREIAAMLLEDMVLRPVQGDVQ